MTTDVPTSEHCTGAIARIGVLTGGGDAPGLNAVIRSVVLAALGRGWECHGIRDGFNGLLAPDTCAGAPVQRLAAEDVHAIGHLGGTILGSTNRGSPLRYPTRQPDGSLAEQDRTGEVVRLCRERGLDALVVIGGDGSMGIADALHRRGLRVVGVPKTIDNDLGHTFSTFGFDTAVGFATDCIDRLHTTAHSQHRAMVVEVMGRYAGWIALHAGIAGGAHAILIPEVPTTSAASLPPSPGASRPATIMRWSWWPRAPGRWRGSAACRRRPKRGGRSASAASAPRSRPNWLR